MKKLFDNYLNQNIRILKSEKIILAISGGADSMAMLHLFSKSRFECCVAHCNFHLRGAESDGDDKFVEDLSFKYNYPFYKIDFDTKKYAKENGISIEMAARDLRYNWFDELRTKLDYQYIATAHHQDDMIETFFINLTRGTGIRGLSGIKAKNDRIIRPMLFTNHSSILAYMKTEKLDFREDSTNSDIKIIRNRLRHQILPILNELNHAAKENIIKTIENLQDTELIMLKEIEHCKMVLNIKDKTNFKINIEKLKQFEPVNAYLFELLRPFGFTTTQLNDIKIALEGISGKIFYSKTHQLLKNRNDLIISTLQNKKPIQLQINEFDENLNLRENSQLEIQKISISGNFEIPKEPNIAAIDFDKLKFPLIVKEWEQGDTFYPLGMKKKKKLSDFFVDEKYSIIDKQKTLLLASDNQIVWVIGKRIDNRFKITEKTKTVLLLKLI